MQLGIELSIFFFNMYTDDSKSFLKLNDHLIFKLDNIKQTLCFSLLNIS